MNKLQKIKNSGQAMLITVLAFLVFSLIAVFGIVNPVLRHSRSLANLEKAKLGLYLTEAGIEDVVYRLKTGKPVAASNVLSIDGENATTIVTDESGGKRIAATGDYNDYIRKIETNLVFGIGVSFFYGLQTGTGGINMSNNAQVIGNVYANGDITGSNGANITGSAYAANQSALTTDQVNDLPLPPSNDMQFGQSSGSEDMAQSFIVSQTDTINKVAVYLKKTSTPSNLTVRITSNNSGNPGSTLAQGSLSASLVTGSYGWVDVPMSSNPELTAGNTYWLVLDGSNNASRYYFWGGNTGYASGQAKIGRFGSSWNNTTPSGLDGYFKIYLGGITSVIDNVDVGTSGTGDAHANTVNNISVTGSLYCQTGSGNNKSCDTSLPDPSPEPFPISDANVSDWKNAAEDGGVTNGNITINSTSSSLGPRKIVGNLTLSNNAELTVTGTLWVTGNITTSNGSIIRLSSSYGSGSGVIVTDGFVNISNNANFQGSGQAGSYLLLISTLVCPGGTGCNSDNAIQVSNNAGTVILNAQKAGIDFSNNAGAKSAVAKIIQLSNGAVITYESGLVNVNFSSGPTGGFDILSWKEIE